MHPQTTAEQPHNLSLSITRVSPKLSSRRLMRRRPSGQKRVSRNSSVKGPVPTASSKIFFGHVLSAAPFNASDVRCARIRGGPIYAGVPDYQPHAIDFSEFRGEPGENECQRYLVSVVVRWRLRKCEKRITLSWRRDVTHERPDRGLSATRLVSLKLVTRRSVVETFTQKW